MLKKRIVSLFCAALMLALPTISAFAEAAPAADDTAAAVQSTESAQEEHTLTYLALGDSITAGLGMPDAQYELDGVKYIMDANYTGYSSSCFVAEVADELGLDREHAINFGLPALLSGDLVELLETGTMASTNRYSGMQYDTPQLQDYVRKADVITIQIGANDALVRFIGALGQASNLKTTMVLYPFMTGALRDFTPKSVFAFLGLIKQNELTAAETKAVLKVLSSGISEICNVAYDEVTANIERSVQAIRALNPDAKILLLGYNNPQPGNLVWTRYFNRLNRFEKQFAAQEGLTYVSIPFTQTALDAHPTAAGHRYIGRQIVKAYKKTLN